MKYALVDNKRTVAGKGEIGELYRALQSITPEHTTVSQLLKALSIVSSDNNEQECLKELLSEKSLGK